MKDSSGIDPVENPGEIPLPENWRGAISSLAAARLAIFKIEFQEAATTGVRRLVLAVAAAILSLIAWLLLVAGGVSAIAATSGASWHWIALAAGGIHIIVAVVLLVIAKKPGAAAFPITLSEFQKDREWFEKCQKSKTSNN